jgi:parallel beta-helix repeat protein
LLALSIVLGPGPTMAQDLVECTALGAPGALPERCTYFVRADFAPAEGVARDGTTPETAFSSIREAAGKLMDPNANPGEVICVGPGTYSDGDIAPGRSGIDGFPIVFFADRTGALTSDPPGPVHIVPGTGGQTTGFLLLGRKHVVIDGFTITGFPDQGIQVRSGGTGITIRNVNVQDCARAGIDVSAEGVVVVETSCSLRNGTSGLSLRGNVDTGEIIVPFVSNTRVGMNGAHGIFVQTASAGLLQNNAVYNNRATGISLRTAPDMQIVNNLVYANGEEGLAIGAASLPSPFAKVLNNTFFSNGQWGIEIGSGPGSPGATILNNILLANGDQNGIGVLNERSQGLTRIPTTCGYTAGFNVNADGYGPSTPRNVYDILRDPLFVDPPGPDGIVGAELVDGRLIDRSADDNFHLRQEIDGSEVSPAVNAGYAPIGTVGLTGSTSDDGRLDTGLIDIGYHYDAVTTQVVSITPPFMPIYVRQNGDDLADGKSPNEALASIAVAGRRARAGVTVVAGPGRYAECDLGPPADGGLATFLGDSTGQRTGDPPGPVLVDAHSENCPLSPGVGEDGFLLSNACFVTVDGFHIRHAIDDGIKVVNQSDGAVIRNNVSFSNRRGIHVINSNDVRLINNLTYANGGGIQTNGTCPGGDCTQAGSRGTWIQNNTCYGNGAQGGVGILIGVGQGVSSHATVLYNIMQKNGTEADGNGIQMGTGGSLEGYTAGFNINAEGRYGTPRPETDLVVDPLFVNPAGPDGVLGGDGFADDDFHLQQLASGQGEDSPAVDWGRDRTAEEAGVADRSTRTDNRRDSGWVDLGFHYSGPIVLLGDCNENGVVTIDELVLGLDIALERAPLSDCPGFDRNRDGALAIDELLGAVETALSASL